MRTPDPEKVKEQQRLTNAFHRVFGSEDGKTVLDNLRKFFRADQCAFMAVDGHVDTHLAAIRDGQRSVILYIEKRLEAETKGDAE